MTYSPSNLIFNDIFIEQAARNFTAVTSRGWGKSFFAGACGATAVFELMELDDSVPNKVCHIIAPTFDQVKDIYYPILVYEMNLDAFCVKPPSRELGRFQFPSNVELRLISFEAIERMRGKGSYFVVNDEMSSWQKKITAKDAWQDIIQPCIVTRWSEERAKYFGAKSPGRSLTISTPKGYNFVYDMFHYPEMDPLWKSYHFDYHSSPFLDPNEIERIRHTIDPISFAQEYLANFEDSGNNVYYMFNRRIHVRPDLMNFIEDETVSFGLDFNVDIMSANFFAIRGNQMQVLDESQGFPNTEEFAKAVRKKYPYPRRVDCYPDPTGNSRKTNAPVGQTDFTILRDYKINVLSRSKSPPIVDSVQATNSKFMTAAGDVGFFIHPRCTNTIKSLERTQWIDKNPDTLTIDKSENIEHWSDGIRYPIEYLWPVKGSHKRTSRGFAF